MTIRSTIVAGLQTLRITSTQQRTAYLSNGIQFNESATQQLVTFSTLAVVEIADVAAFATSATTTGILAATEASDTVHIIAPTAGRLIATEASDIVFILIPTIATLAVTEVSDSMRFRVDAQPRHTPRPIPPYAPPKPLDIRLVQNTAFPQYSVTVDWSLMQNGTLDTDEALATSVIVALGTDALASRDDLLPDPDSTDRAGWWGDLDAEEIWEGWPIGTKLWLLRRSKIEGVNSKYGSTVVRVDQYIRDAIQPFIDHRIASYMEVEVARTGRERIEAYIQIYRGPRLAVELRYEVLWDEIATA